MKILENSRSSADIIFYGAFLKLGIDNAQLKYVSTPLVDFYEEIVKLLGKVVLSLLWVLTLSKLRR